MGQTDTEEKAGGPDEENRQAAIALAQRALDDSEHLYIIQVKATATADGHSFSLLMNHDKTVSVLEGWAMGPGDTQGCTLGRIWNRRTHHGQKQYLTVKETKSYLNNILHWTEFIRDIGYGGLSSAYGEPHPCHGFEKLNTEGEHDKRERHSIEVTLQKLRPYNEVKKRLGERRAALKAIYFDGTYVPVGLE